MNLFFIILDFNFVNAIWNYQNYYNNFGSVLSAVDISYFVLRLEGAYSNSLENFKHIYYLVPI